MFDSKLFIIKNNILRWFWNSNCSSSYGEKSFWSGFDPFTRDESQQRQKSITRFWGGNNMRRVVILAILALVLPVAAFADGIDVQNRWGSATVSLAGITSTQSQMNSYNGISMPKGSGLGYVYFKTGAFSGSNLSQSGTFSASGSVFDIYSNGSHGLGKKGMIFSGAFVGPIDWTVTSAPGSRRMTFTLTGEIKGMLYGHESTGSTTQYFYSYAEPIRQRDCPHDQWQHSPVGLTGARHSGSSGNGSGWDRWPVPP